MESWLATTAVDVTTATIQPTMKVFILLALVAVSQAASLVYAPAFAAGGGSTQYRSQDNHGNYNFGYDEGHLSGGTFRKETGDAHGNVAGSYGLRDADGRVRVVNYVADAAGFRADIKTNEPGVEPKDPANTSINKAPVILAAPATYAHAPLVSYAHSPVVNYAHAPVVNYAHAPVVNYAHAPALHYAHSPVLAAAPHYGYPYHY